MGMTYDIRIEGRELSVEVESTDAGWRVRTLGEDGPGPWQDLPGRFVRDGELIFQHAGRNRAVGVHTKADRATLQVDGHHLVADVIDPRKVRADLAGGAGEGVVSTPMPGVVVRIPASEGQEVAAGDVLVVVEAMKMENEFKAPIAGVVESIEVSVGQTLESDTVLARIEPAS